MSIKLTALVASAAFFVAAVGFSSTASAQSVMQQCSVKYQAAKTAGTLGGATWGAFLKQCRSTTTAIPAAVTTPAVAAPAVVAPKPIIPVAAPKPLPVAPVAPTAATAAKPVSAGRAAETTRIKTCGAQWKANKVQLIAATPGLTWPKYWSACNKQMKANGQ